MAEKSRRPVDIVVPGSISNLGPGFDALSVAVQVYLRARVVEVRPSEPDTISWEFDGAGPTGENRIESAFRLARKQVGTPAPGLRGQVSSEIPQAAGLGSSAAAAVAGLRIYESVTVPRATEDWLAMATELEGHPDNAAAALLGGVTVSCQREDGGIMARSSRWPEAVKIIVATPDTGLHTSHARQVLPTEVALTDAIFNLQRALLLVHAPGRAAMTIYGGDEGSLASVGAGRAHLGRRSHCLRRSGDPRRLPQRRGPSSCPGADGAAKARRFSTYAEPGLPACQNLSAHQPFACQIRGRSGQARRS